MPLPNYVANNSYSIKYIQGDDYAYKTYKKDVGIGKDKRKKYITVFTRLTTAEYTTEIADNWS